MSARKKAAGKGSVDPPDTPESRSAKARVTIFLDLDVLNFFKGLAEKPGAPGYQTQINAVLRERVEQSNNTDSTPAEDLRQAKSLIDAALRQIRQSHP